MILQGEIWVADLNPTRGHEQAKTRPVLIVSNDGFNNGPAELVTVVPVTGTNRGIPLHVPVSPPDGGLAKPSVILCDQVRTISTARLSRRVGKLGAPAFAEVQDRLRILMDL